MIFTAKEYKKNHLYNGKAIERAKNMLLDNEDVEKIIRYTKLSIDEVRKLKEVMEL
ncbi:MAG: hypothetical protein AB6733_23445 [Clostridiaceae bacterium]